MPVRGEFLQGVAGQLALVGWRPPEGTPLRFAVLHLPAFGDEMNKSRRTVAMQARAFEAMGGAAFVLDPRGTGDSAGEFGDATWAGWRADAAAAWARVGEQCGEGVPRVLWGLRLGALLACDLVATAAVEPDLLLLWQPATSGRAFFDQFLRIAGVQSVTGGGAARDRKVLRAELAAGRSVEIGGYELSPTMVSGAEAVDLAGLRAPGCPVIWRETSSAEPPAMGVASSRVVAGWRPSGARIDDSATRGPSFWTTLEIEEAPALVESTCEAVARFLASGAPR